MTAARSSAIGPGSITGVVLAGGRGSRMDGVDKGLVPWQGRALALHALQRLQPQVHACCISANRHAEDYARFGVPVLADTVPGYAGPLAGLLAALRHATTDFVATVPCDVPHYPADIVARLAAGVAGHTTGIAVALSADRQADGSSAWRRQPLFCLVPVARAASLEAFLAAGRRKAGEWLGEQQACGVPIAAPPMAFANVNTAAELQALLP